MKLITYSSSLLLQNCCWRCCCWWWWWWCWWSVISCSQQKFCGFFDQKIGKVSEFWELLNFEDWFHVEKFFPKKIHVYGWGWGNNLLLLLLLVGLLCTTSNQWQSILKFFFSYVLVSFANNSSLFMSIIVISNISHILVPQNFLSLEINPKWKKHFSAKREREKLEPHNPAFFLKNFKKIK
jgi:hypothetical protein